MGTLGCHLPIWCTLSPRRRPQSGATSVSAEDPAGWGDCRVTLAYPQIVQRRAWQDTHSTWQMTINCPGRPCCSSLTFQDHELCDSLCNVRILRADGWPGLLRSGNVRLPGDFVQVGGDTGHLVTCAMAPEPGAALLPGVRGIERAVPHSGCVQAAQVRGEPHVSVRRGRGLGGGSHGLRGRRLGRRGLGWISGTMVTIRAAA